MHKLLFCGWANAPLLVDTPGLLGQIDHIIWEDKEVFVGVVSGKWHTRS